MFRQNIWPREGIIKEKALSHDKTDFLRDSKHDPSCLILPMVGFRLRPARHRRCHPELVELLGQRPKSTRRSRSGILAGLRSEWHASVSQKIAQNQPFGVTEPKTLLAEEATAFITGIGSPYRRSNKKGAHQWRNAPKKHVPSIVTTQFSLYLGNEQKENTPFTKVVFP